MEVSEKDPRDKIREEPIESEINKWKAKGFGLTFLMKTYCWPPWPDGEKRYMTAETNELVILNPPDTTKIKPSTNESIWETVIDTEVSHSSIWPDTTNKSNKLLGGYISTRATSTGNMKRLASPRLISWFPPGLGTMKNVNENQKISMALNLSAQGIYLLTLETSFAGSYSFWSFSYAHGRFWYHLAHLLSKPEVLNQQATISIQPKQEIVSYHLFWRPKNSIPDPISEILTDFFKFGQNGGITEKMRVCLVWKPGLGVLSTPCSYFGQIIRLWKIFGNSGQFLNLSLRKFGEI